MTILVLTLIGLIAQAPSTAAAPAASPTPQLPQQTTQEWIAKVGDETITALEFEHDLAYRLKVYQKSAGESVAPDKQFRTDTLNELIDGRILKILARNSGIVVADPDLDAEVEKGKRALGNAEAFQAYLHKENLTEEALREQVHDRLITEKFIADKTKGLDVTPEEAQKTCAEWQAAGKLNRSTETVDLEHILVQANPADEKSWDEGKKKIDNIRRRIVAGEKFETVAKEVSDDATSKDRGGIYYESANGQTLPEIEKRMNELAPGELSEPFRSHAGWHLIKVLAKNQPGMVPCEKVQQRIHDFLLAQKKQAVIARLVDDARKIINIEINKAPAPSAAPRRP